MVTVIIVVILNIGLISLAFRRSTVAETTWRGVLPGAAIAAVACAPAARTMDVQRKPVVRRTPRPTLRGWFLSPRESPGDLLTQYLPVRRLSGAEGKWVRVLPAEKPKGGADSRSHDGRGP